MCLVFLFKKRRIRLKCVGQRICFKNLFHPLHGILMRQFSFYHNTKACHMPLYMRKDMDRSGKGSIARNVLPANGKSVPESPPPSDAPADSGNSYRERQKALGASLSDGSLILVLYDKNCFFLSAPLLFSCLYRNFSCRLAAPCQAQRRTWTLAAERLSRRNADNGSQLYEA